MTEARRTYRRLRIVDDILGYLPFHAGAPNLIEEHSSVESPLEYEAKALAYISELVKDPRISLIILTGDAGHGKTHLCRRLLENEGLSRSAALERLKDDPRGAKPIPTASGRPLRVVKDISEVPDGPAVELLNDFASDSESVGIVCANEGRLRALVSRDARLSGLLDGLRASMENGQTSADGRAHVVNLNYQSVAPMDGGFLEYVLDEWASNGRRWASCAQCLAAESCPINKNRRLLAGKDPGSRSWRDGLLTLVRITEQSNYVLTFREALIAMAYLITGGRDCAEVEKLHRNARQDRLESEGLVYLLFERSLDPQQRAQLKVVEKIRRRDPGHVPLRKVDEGIVEELETQGKLGSGAWYAQNDPPTSRRRLAQEAESFVKLVRTARREAYFKNPSQGSDESADRARRLGLFHYSDFEFVQSDDEKSSRMMLDVLSRVIKGLHVIQGIRPVSDGDLLIVDPAFARSSLGTSVIAREIPRRALYLLGLHEYWAVKGEPKPGMTRAVDWLDRELVLVDEKLNTKLLTLDLLQFEFVMRAAEGTAFPEFHASDRRRILQKLGALASEDGRSNDRIRIIVGQQLRTVTPERDGSIRVSEAQ